ncbi:hypothetical protein CTAYLR_005534 [Chrysophaeum taylorii]|uniref:GPI mannosyltransferase 2 n=1 Tax=Chrysophaeum taylorii TaxID=2483200 RepID=A0AAD7U6M7_9STRA|nr:hypothetical protein CTAYLR_005534 [Chrysophaeum taylorii]
MSESDCAFFPGYPLVVRWVAAVTGNVVVAGVLVSNAAFVGAVAQLGACGGRAAAVALCISPASVFFSTCYAESLFALFAFAGLNCRHRREQWKAAIAFAAAATVRSNGCLLAAFVVTLDLPASLVRVGIVALPGLVHDALNRARFCAVAPRFCAKWPPRSFYRRAQRRYWNVGLLRYWRLRQLPNFCLGAPAIALSASKLTFSPIGLHCAATILLLLLVAHVQISTRVLAASTIPFHAAIADRLTTPPMLLYLVAFAVFGTAAHVNFLPFT